MSRSQAPAATLLAPFFPALDGLRAIAFLMVFFNHYGVMVWQNPVLRSAWTGVDLFFVLSGFLITGILFDSVNRQSYFKHFYIRRALRIFPLFYGFWFVALVLTPVLHFSWNRYIVAMAAYAGNFFLPGSRMGLHANPGHLFYGSLRHPGVRRNMLVGHLWSLCVEEQFYLAWPAIVWTLRSRRSLLQFCWAGIAATIVGRTLYVHWCPEMLSSGALYFNTFSRIDTLLVGAMLALWLRGTTISRLAVRRLAGVTAIAAPLLLIFLVSLEKSSPSETFGDPVVSSVGFSLIAFAAAGVLVLAIDVDSTLYHLLNLRPLVHLGRISYGAYFFHAFPMLFVAEHIPALTAHHLAFLGPLAAFLTTIALAELSFRILESPFLRMKNKLAPGPPSIPVGKEEMSKFVGRLSPASPSAC